MYCSDGEHTASSDPWLEANGNRRKSLFTHLVVHVPLLRIAHGMDARCSHPPSSNQKQQMHGISSLSESLHSVSSPRISAQPQSAHQSNFRAAFREDLAAEQKAAGSIHGSKSGGELQSTLTIQACSYTESSFPGVGGICVTHLYLIVQAQVMVHWQQSTTEACVDPGSEAHPLLQDVRLFITMMDCAADACASKPQTYLHVSLHPFVTIMMAPDSFGVLKVAADAVLSHVVRLPPMPVDDRSRRKHVSTLAPCILIS